MTSLFVLAGGGFYLFTQYRAISSGSLLLEQELTLSHSDIVPDYFNNSSSTKQKNRNKVKPAPRRNTSAAAHQFNTGDILEDVYGIKKPSVSYENSGFNTGSYSYLSKKSKDKVFIPANNLFGSMYTYDGTGKRSSGADITQEGNYSSLSIATAPLLVPFSNSYTGTPTTTGGTILFDPGIETLNIEENTIPVGEGWWVLLLMGVGYFQYQRLKT